MPRGGNPKKPKAKNKLARGRKLRGNLRLENVSTQAELHRRAKKRDAIYVGATDDPHRRLRDHAKEGYSGTMYVARTENMRLAEDKLLKSGSYRYNTQELSNVDEAPIVLCNWIIFTG